jgi:hypothetical protein
MSTDNIRLIQVNTPVNTTITNEKWINSGVSAYDGVFETTTINTDCRAGLYEYNNFLYHATKTIDLPSTFTIAMWARFVSRPITDRPCYFGLIFEDGTSIVNTIPDTITKTNNNYYTISRDSSGLVSFKINGTTIGTDTNNTADVNLSSASYVLLGNLDDVNCTGYDVIMDDLIIANETVDKALSTTLPTDYLLQYVPPNSILLHLKIY